MQVNMDPNDLPYFVHCYHCASLTSATTTSATTTTTIAATLVILLQGAWVVPARHVEQATYLQNIGKLGVFGT